MDVSQQGLLELLGQPAVRFVIPAYQRTYSWSTDQCEELWLDVLRAARYGRNHFLGTVLYLPVDASPEVDCPLRDPFGAQSLRTLEVIDGQQRITTTSLLLLALIRWTKAAGATFDGMGAEELKERFLVTGEGGALTKLEPSSTDRRAYHDAVLEDASGTTPEVATTARASRIFANLAFFEEKMAEEGFDAQALWRGIQRLLVIEVAVEDASAAQSIFEGINSKGMPLNVADMVRNYLLLSENHDEQTRLFEEYWDPIQDMFAPDPGSLRLDTAIKSWLAIRLKGARIRSPEQVYSSFKRFVEDKYQGEKEPILRELRGFSLMWAQNYRYHGSKKYKSGSNWAEIGAPTLTAGYKLKKPDNEEYAARVRAELDRVDTTW